MKLQFLGYGSGYNPGLGNTNAFFTQGDTLFLLDCGFTAFPELMKREMLQGIGGLVIILTHLHADHCGSFPMVISYAFNKMKIRPDLIYPGDSVADFLTLTGIGEEEYRLLPEVSAPALITVEPVPVNHTPLMDCYGYIIRDKDSALYYSGDAAMVPPEVLEKFRSGDIREIYQDTTMELGDDPSHGSLEKLGKIFPPEQRDRVFCMHYGKDFSTMIRQQGFRTVGDEDT